MNHLNWSEAQNTTFNLNFRKKDLTEEIPVILCFNMKTIHKRKIAVSRQFLFAYSGHFVTSYYDRYQNYFGIFFKLLCCGCFVHPPPVCESLNSVLDIIRTSRRSDLKERFKSFCGIYPGLLMLELMWFRIWIFTYKVFGKKIVLCYDELHLMKIVRNMHEISQMQLL